MLPSLGRAVEPDFYRDLTALRGRIVAALDAKAPGRTTDGQRVRIARTLLDRWVFVLFCEDLRPAHGEPLRGLLSRFGAGTRAPGEPSLRDQLHERFAFWRGELAGRSRQDAELFAQNAALDAMDLPEDLLIGGPKNRRATLLRLATDYRFGAPATPPQRAVALSALGAVFERSIADPARQQRGVFYTPGWVIAAIVEQTLGDRLRALRREVGPDEAVDLARLDAYAARLGSFAVLDPACGAGAFLVEALSRIAEERRWIAEARHRLLGQDPPIDRGEAVCATLRDNVYGVDRSAEAAALTRLVLGLHLLTFDRPKEPLNLNIRCGDSLVDPTQFRACAHPDAAPLQPFDWQAEFPEVFARGGFDCVLGNPPYVKLQRLRQEDAPLARFLVEARREDGAPLYRSAQTGSFDLVLPFIERGLSLLRPNGEMGLIAPSLWLINASGVGLRRLVHETRTLDRWVDLGAVQAFDQAITYTALQFFTRAPGQRIRFAREDSVTYAELAPDGPWQLAPQSERALLARLRVECARLDDPALTTQIFQGIITGADAVYHLRKLGEGRYQAPKTGEVVALEDAIMRPLVSGKDARRYRAPSPALCLLFPYCTDGARARLWSEAELRGQFPKAMAWLDRHESSLRRRDGGKLDGEAWYRFSRTQALDKQARPKLGVAETAPALRVFADPAGQLCLNNVRVNGVLATDAETLWFLLGVLNAPVASFVLRRTARPHDGGFFAANKQFIAPLPIPSATTGQRQAVGDCARRLQALTTRQNEADRTEIRALEAHIDALVFALYALSEAERAMVLADGLSPAESDRRGGSARRPWARSASR